MERGRPGKISADQRPLPNANWRKHVLFMFMCLLTADGMLIHVAIMRHLYVDYVFCNNSHCAVYMC